MPMSEHTENFFRSSGQIGRTGKINAFCSKESDVTAAFFVRSRGRLPRSFGQSDGEGDPNRVDFLFNMSLFSRPFLAIICNRYRIIRSWRFTRKDWLLPFRVLYFGLFGRICHEIEIRERGYGYWYLYVDMYCHDFPTKIIILVIVICPKNKKSMT